MQEGGNPKPMPPRVQYDQTEDFTNIPMSEFVSMVLLTGGGANLVLNGKPVSLTAPCMLLISKYDQIKLVDSSRMQATAFHFTPDFLNSSLSFERLAADDFTALEDLHDRNVMNVFIKRDEYYYGVIDLQPHMFLRISEWITVMGREICNPSDGFWICRIRRYLLQTLYLLEEIYLTREMPNTIRREKSPVDLVLEYIHTNYSNKITLDSLCSLIHLNRTSLSRIFKERTGHAPMDYLLSHRLKIACETLTHTALNLSEISESLGFKYETYFIRQFNDKIGISPTEYRKKHGLGPGWST